MATLEYGGGAGGKFQKRPFRRATSTPYDRPQTAIRRANPNPNLNSNGNWISKIVDPASRIITKGALKLFSSVFQKRITAAPIPIPEENSISRNESPGDAGNSPQIQKPLEAALGSGGSTIANASDNSDLNGSINAKANASNSSETKGTSQAQIPSTGGVFDIELLLKKKTFTRAEFDRLTDLLRSRTVESSSTSKQQVDFGTNEEAVFSEQEKEKEKEKENQKSTIEPSIPLPVILRKEKGLLSEQGNEKRSSTLRGNITSPAADFHIPEDETVSPEQIAKEYMGSRTSKVSHSSLGVRSRLSEDSIYPIVPYAKRPSTPFPASRTPGLFSGISEHSEYGYITPRPRGRSAIYKMSRAPYFNSTLSSCSRDGKSNYASSPFVPLNNMVSSSKQAQKRGRSVLENDLGSYGPIRWTRQKSHLSSTYCQRELFSPVDHVSRHKDNTTPFTSMSYVPTRSTEMAMKIFEQLGKLEASPREKLSETKGSGNCDVASDSSVLKLKNSKLKENGPSENDIVAVKSDAVATISSKKDAVVLVSNAEASLELDVNKNNRGSASGVASTETDKLLDKSLPSSSKSGTSLSSILKIKGDVKASNKPATEKRVDFTLPSTILVSNSRPSPKRKEIYAPVPNLSTEGSSSIPPTTNVIETSDSDKGIKHQKDADQINGFVTSTSSSFSTTSLENSAIPSILSKTAAETISSSKSPFQFGPNSSTIDTSSAVSPSAKISNQELDANSLNGSIPLKTPNASSNTNNSGNIIFGFTASSTPISSLGSIFTSQTTQPTFRLNNDSSSLSFTSSAVTNMFSSNSQSTQATIGLNNIASTAQSFTPSATTNLFSSNSQPSLSTFASTFASNTSLSSSLASPSPIQPVFEFNKQTQSSPGSDKMNVEVSMTDDKVQATLSTFSSNAQFTPPATQAVGQPVFQFAGNTNNSNAPQNSTLAQAPGNFQFSANGNFSLGSGGGDKGGRRFFRAKRDRPKNR